MKYKSQALKKKTAFSWSSGKDSSYALHLLNRTGLYDVRYLVTTVTDSYRRVSIHGVREELLEEQAKSLGIPLMKVEIPPDCTNEIYERKMLEVTRRLRSEGIEHMAFGDIFLQDIREYRERKLAGTGIEPLFPLWGRDTGKLANEIINAGIKARITCLDPSKIQPDLAGMEYDSGLLESLPETADKCGENGEFHTFVYGSPMFATDLKIKTGKTVKRDGFVFTDLIPG